MVIVHCGQWTPDFCTESFLGGCNVGIVRKGETRGIILHPSALDGVTVNESEPEIYEGKPLEVAHWGTHSKLVTLMWFLLVKGPIKGFYLELGKLHGLLLKSVAGISR